MAIVAHVAVTTPHVAFRTSAAVDANQADVGDAFAPAKFTVHLHTLLLPQGQTWGAP